LIAIINEVIERVRVVQQSPKLNIIKIKKDGNLKMVFSAASALHAAFIFVRKTYINSRFQKAKRQ
jgi:hypothetical protein